MCSPARVPFRQFFKIKSLSVLVKCISRPPEPTPGRVYQHQHQQPLMPLVARSRALLCHSLPSLSPTPSPQVDPRAAPNDRQLAAKKSV